MKKVIIEYNEEVIRLKDITDDMIVGLLWNSGRKSFLIKDYNKKTIVLDLNTRTTAGHWKEKTHKEYINFLGKDMKGVFVFDSPKELAQWLAE